MIIWKAAMRACERSASFSRCRVHFGMPAGSIDFNSKRQLSTSLRNLAAKARDSQKFPKLSPKRYQTPVADKSAPYESPTGRLANRRSPTLIYQSASHLPYILGCYIVGGGLIAMAGFNFYTQYLYRAGEVPKYIPFFVNIGSFIIVCVGAYVCLRPQNMVRTISSVPSRTNSGSRSVLLQIERSRSVPLITPKVITVPPSDVTISAPLFLGGPEQILAEMAEMKRREDRANAFDKKSILTLPFRQAGYWIGRGFGGVRKAFTGEGLVNLHIKGNNISWKIDRDTAWALDDGQALDKIVRIRIG